MRTSLLCCIATVAGCATEPDFGVYRVAWIQVDDAHKICVDRTGAAPLFLRIKGCVVRRDGICTIYAPRPKSTADIQAFTTLGHEAMHCFEGDWHDQWGEMTKHQPR